MKKFLAIIVFLVGLLLVLDILIPGSLQKFRSLPVINNLFYQGESWLKTNQQGVKKVLGTAITKGRFNNQGLTNQVEKISSQILKSEKGQQTQEEVNQLINEIVLGIRQLPEAQMKKIRQELKRQICEEWMKEY